MGEASPARTATRRPRTILNALLNPRPRIAVPATVPEQLDAAEREQLVADIKNLLIARDAVLVAHYYTDPAIQALADDTEATFRLGARLAMSILPDPGRGRRGFMGETAKILNPEKQVLMLTSRRMLAGSGCLPGIRRLLLGASRPYGGGLREHSAAVKARVTGW